MGALTVHAVEGPLERAVTNMVHNALRHGASLIEIVAGMRAEQAEIHVSDRGTVPYRNAATSPDNRHSRARTSAPGSAPAKWPSSSPPVKTG